jgi:hypothetical protein
MWSLHAEVFGHVDARRRADEQQHALPLPAPPEPSLLNTIPEIHRRWCVGLTRADMNTIRGGVQVHAVPEHERAFDSSGKRMPWGYEYPEYVHPH